MVNGNGAVRCQGGGQKAGEAETGDRSVPHAQKKSPCLNSVKSNGAKSNALKPSTHAALRGVLISMGC